MGIDTDIYMYIYTHVYAQDNYVLYLPITDVNYTVYILTDDINGSHVYIFGLFCIIYRIPKFSYYYYNGHYNLLLVSPLHQNLPNDSEISIGMTNVY